MTRDRRSSVSVLAHPQLFLANEPESSNPADIICAVVNDHLEGISLYDIYYYKNKI